MRKQGLTGKLTDNQLIESRLSALSILPTLFPDLRTSLRPLLTWPLPMQPFLQIGSKMSSPRQLDLTPLVLSITLPLARCPSSEKGSAPASGGGSVFVLAPINSEVFRACNWKTMKLKDKRNDTATFTAAPT